MIHLSVLIQVSLKMNKLPVFQAIYSACTKKYNIQLTTPSQSSCGKHEYGTDLTIPNILFMLFKSFYSINGDENENLLKPLINTMYSQYHVITRPNELLNTNGQQEMYGVKTLFTYELIPNFPSNI